MAETALIPRPQYLKALRTFRDVPLVKIMSGVRRCGKSTLLLMLRENLLESGVPGDRIISVSFSRETCGEKPTHQEMHRYLMERISGRDGKHYLLLDEVQEVENWERAVNSLLEEADTDIYVTGSNSRLLLEEISSYLTGRVVFIPVYTLSFAEYFEAKGKGRRARDVLDEYLLRGGFPVTARYGLDEQAAWQAAGGIYLTVVENDIRRRNRITDSDLFGRVTRYVVENMGRTFSANTVARFLKSERRSLGVEKVYNYLDWLEKAFIVYRCRRFDLQGKAVLRTQEKFYLADHSFRHSIIGYSRDSISAVLENVVYLDLRRRGYEVYIGKNSDREIDFVASRRDERVYVQVCAAMPPGSDRETANLLEIRDHYPKYVVTLDSLAGGNVNGVKIMHATDFLLEDRL